MKSLLRDILSLVSPAARTALILGALVTAFLTLATLWIGNEARRIKTERDSTLVTNRRQVETGEMIWIAPGGFTMGGIGEMARADESPLHDVKIDGFWMDRTEVTNGQFERFTAETGYITVAERTVTRRIPASHPDLDGMSFALCATLGTANGWEYRIGANWRHPRGPASNIQGREKHPVTQVCYEDAQAYCRWATKRLPTEAEWEFAARGGLVAQPYVWGPELNPGGKTMANILQTPGSVGTMPAGSFPANGSGLVDMAGNVRELTEDWYNGAYYSVFSHNPDRAIRRNPAGPKEGEDPDEPGIWKKVARGGSYLSGPADGYGFRPSARMKIALDEAREDVGFRCARSVGP